MPGLGLGVRQASTPAANQPHCQLMRAPHIASRIGVLLGIASVTLHGQSTGFTYQA